MKLNHIGFGICFFQLNLLILATALFHLFGAATSFILKATKKCNRLYLTAAKVNIHLGSCAGEGESSE